MKSFRRTHPNRDPVEERRSKTHVALEQKKLVLAAALEGQEHAVTKPGWALDVDGNRQRVEKTHAVRPWIFISGAQGRIRTTDTRIFSPLLYQLSYLGNIRANLIHKTRPYGVIIIA